ncbi:GLPGLI family protein [Chryseobacterium sp. PBS4-4]|uniref:GLPGLI family protein n=1 Tax=Chryseobacterium edaphi TaxID=2976532 RepID=A0ABT2W8U9_9FLAO|nr:GLPGLI family protein [Chryseobacterium edaphi]MCU7618616.1 GLPGLI family protein [Chryseobacterium edaphi]
MNKIFLFLIFVIVLKLNAQNQRFIYEYKYVPDSTKVDSVLTENMRLTIFKDHSEFLSEMKAKRDSAIVKSSQKNNGKIGTDLSPGNIKTFVWKNKNNSKNYSTEFVGMESYKVTDETDFNWTLIDETKKIQNYNCQKAILKFGRREWTAWFTTELPFQDGPHIFCKLPGLIVTIEDSKKHHSFQLIANYKTNDGTSVMKAFHLLKNYKVNRKQFNKKWNDFRKNPISANEQFLLMNPQITQFKSYDENGNEMDANALRKAGTEKAKKNLVKNNNFLDLELYR